MRHEFMYLRACAWASSIFCDATMVPNRVNSCKVCTMHTFNGIILSLNLVDSIRNWTCTIVLLNNCKILKQQSASHTKHTMDEWMNEWIVKKILINRMVHTEYWQFKVWPLVWCKKRGKCADANFGCTTHGRESNAKMHLIYANKEHRRGWERATRRDPIS